MSGDCSMIFLRSPLDHTMNAFIGRLMWPDAVLHQSVSFVQGHRAASHEFALLRVQRLPGQVALRFQALGLLHHDPRRDCAPTRAARSRAGLPARPSTFPGKLQSPGHPASAAPPSPAPFQSAHSGCGDSGRPRAGQLRAMTREEEAAAAAAVVGAARDPSLSFSPAPGSAAGAGPPRNSQARARSFCKKLRALSN